MSTSAAANGTVRLLLIGRLLVFPLHGFRQLKTRYANRCMRKPRNVFAVAVAGGCLFIRSAHNALMCDDGLIDPGVPLDPLVAESRRLLELSSKLANQMDEEDHRSQRMMEKSRLAVHRAIQMFHLYRR